MSSSTTPTTGHIYGVNSESLEVAQINTNANHIETLAPSRGNDEPTNNISSPPIQQLQSPNNTSSLAIPPSVQQSPPPSVSTYLGRHSEQAERLQSIEKFIKKHPEHNPYHPLSPDDNNNSNNNTVPDNNTSSCDDVSFAAPVFDNPPTNHLDCPRAVCSVEIVSASPDIHITSGSNIVTFLHGPCHHVSSGGAKPCQYGDGLCNWDHDTKEPKTRDLILPTLNKRPTAFSYHPSRAGGMPIIAVHSVKEEGGMNNWVGQDSIEWSQIYDDDTDKKDFSLAERRLVMEGSHLEQYRRGKMKELDIYLPQLGRSSFSYLDYASDDEIAEERERVDIQGCMMDICVCITEAVPLSAEEEAAQTYQDFIVKYYEYASSGQKNKLSIASTRQPPRNSVQQKMYDEVLSFTIDIIEYLVENDAVLIPGSHAFDDIKYEQFSIDNGNGHIYWFLQQLKLGLAGVGKERKVEYVNKYPNTILTLISCIDIDNLKRDVQVEVVRRIREGLARFLPHELPTTHLEALLVEMFGLPIATTHFFWAVVKSIEECPIMGGAIEIQSFLRRIVLCIFESGLQEFVRKRDPSSINHSSIKHEFINGNFLGFYIWAILQAKEDVDELLWSFPPAERAVLMMCIIQAIEKSTWPPGRLNEETKNHIGATNCILNNIVGEKNWSDSTPLTPLDCLEEDEIILQEAVQFGCEKCIAEASTGEKSSTDHDEKCPRKPATKHCYAMWFYKSKHQLDMMGNKDISLNDVVADGGAIFLDEDKLATQVLNDGAGMDLVDYILESKPTLPNGEIGEWYFYREYLKNVVLKMDYVGDSHIRLAVVHVRTCDMLNTDPQKQYDRDTVGDLSLSGRSMQWLQEVAQQLSSPNTNLVTNKSLHRPLDNLLFPWTICYGDAILNKHLSPKSGSLWFKNYRNGGVNLFAMGMNGLRKRNNYDIFGITERSKLSKKRNSSREQIEEVVEDDEEERDNKILSKIARHLTSLPKDCDSDEYERSLHEAADMIRDATPTTASARYKKFIRLFIDGQLQLDFIRVYDKDRNNPGNVNANYSAPPAAVAANDIEVEEMARTGNWYIVQSRVVPGADPPKAGTDFTLPAVNELITSPKCLDGRYHYDGGLNEVRFGTMPPAQFASGLVLGGLMERVKNKGGAAIHFTNYKIETPMIPQAPGPGKRPTRMTILHNSNNGQNLTDQNVCVVRLVRDYKKGEKPVSEEQRLRELDAHVAAHKMKKKSKKKKSRK